MAINAPSRHCWPEKATAPVTGCNTPTLIGFGWAPPTIGNASADAAAVAWAMKWRRLCKGVFMGFSPGG